MRKNHVFAAHFLRLPEACSCVSFLGSVRGSPHPALGQKGAPGEGCGSPGSPLSAAGLGVVASPGVVLVTPKGRSSHVPPRACSPRGRA